ncbi:ABC transporter ATP-binding protein [Salicibibacter kimchii]|nr:dipeptide/oligopeptide/nickel ABC transporter ATP-binding protein [Salicibibacter kimchii]
MVIEVHNVAKRYSKKCKQGVLQDISLQIERQTCLALLGESGTGKSTLGRIMVGLEPINKGDILFNGEKLLAGRHKHFAGKIQMAFQDPLSAFNPRITIGESLAEPLFVEKAGNSERTERINGLCNDVQLDLELLHRFPNQLSGGQLQRAAIARALMSRPSFVVLDEVVSSLDVIHQHHILELLNTLKKTYGLSYLFITHDFLAANYVADRIAVLHDGAIIDHAEKKANGKWKFVHPQAVRLQEAAL